MKLLNMLAAMICAILYKRGKNFKESYFYWLHLGGKP